MKKNPTKKPIFISKKEVEKSEDLFKFQSLFIVHEMGEERKISEDLWVYLKKEGNANILKDVFFFLPNNQISTKKHIFDFWLSQQSITVDHLALMVVSVRDCPQLSQYFLDGFKKAGELRKEEKKKLKLVPKKAKKRELVA